MQRCLILFVLLAAATRVAGAEPADRGAFAKWSPIELIFQGPDSQTRGEPNPFSARMDVSFASPNGQRYVVPAFYDGDGKGGSDGNVWKVRFSADRIGRWTYTTKSSIKRLDGDRGAFRVGDVAADAKGFWKWGRLESVSTAENKIRYLKFRDGPYWLKAGCDDPENFLGRYRHFDTLAKRKAAVDYLAGKGINSLYIMTHNIGGDDKDVWPWLGANAAEAMKNATRGHVRFDLQKMSEWRELFEHMQTRGVAPYLVLEDDSAWKGYDQESYHREIIARFGDLPAVLFNLGEEHNENYSLRESLAMAERFKQRDPYDHPLGIHNVNRPAEAYIKSPHVDFTAIQTGSPGRRRSLDHALAHNRIAIDWIDGCRKRNARVLTVNFDEGRPEHDRRAWWSAYLGGGVWEAHILPPYDRPHSESDKVWTELGGAGAFMRSLPFWEMQPSNGLVTDGQAFCLAKAGVAYGLYLPRGGEVTVKLSPGAYEFGWWKTDQGAAGTFRAKGRVAGGPRAFAAPSAGDWALRILAAKRD